MELFAQFFDGYTWEQLIGMFFALFFGFLPGFNLFNWLKAKWNIEGQAAHWMVLALSVIITMAAMLLTGALDLSGFEFTFAKIMEYASFVYVGSQIAYKRFVAAQIAKVEVE